MAECVLCKNEEGIVPLYKSERKKAFVCKDCMKDPDNLFRLARDKDPSAYERYREEFIEDFSESEYVNEIVSQADREWQETFARPAEEPAPEYDTEDFADEDAEAEVETYVSDAEAEPPVGNAVPAGSFQAEAFYPFKLHLCTVLGLIALFTSALGLIPSFIAHQMACELPDSFSPVDVRRARQISQAALIINALEVLAGIIIGIVILADTL